MSKVKQSLKTFTADINQALQSNLLSFSEAEELSSALGVIQARLNRHRNSSASINKLPAEILARIFEFVIAPEPLHDLCDWPPSSPPREATWNRRLVFVCTRWYTIATRWQRMWYYIVDNDVDDFKNYSPRAVLRRSGSAVPLHLYMSSTPQPTTKSVSRWVIKNQPLRVEALFIQLLGQTRIEEMLESLATPLPSLRLLSVDASWDCGKVVGPDMPIILGGEALSLKALVWSLSIPFIPGNAFPNLVDMNLNQMGGNVLNLDSLLRLLPNCPRLETLVLVQNSFDVTSGMARDRGPVALDHLRALWIHSMQANAALTALAYLQLPTNATVRLSDLAQNYSEPRELPTAPVPFLQQMDHLTRLDVITCVGRHASLHFVAVGAYSRFWIHINVVGPRVRPYVRFLYGMLPKNNLQTLRFSMQDIDDFIFIRDTMLDPLPSLNSLFVRHGKVASPRDASSGIVALSRALCQPVKGEAPEPDTSHTQSDSDPEVSSHGYSDSDSDRYSGSDSDDVDYSDHPFEAARRSLDTPHNHDSHCANSPIEISENVPAPQLKVVGLEVKCASTASLESFVRMVEARKKSGHPLDTVLCSFEGVDRKDVDGMREHLVDGVRDVGGKLWVPTIDEAWLMKNDYWRLYPELRDEHEDEDDYAVEWGFNLRKW